MGSRWSSTRRRVCAHARDAAPAISRLAAIPCPADRPDEGERARARRVRQILLKYGSAKAPLGLRI